MPVISAALFARFASRQDDSPAMKAVAALRNQFGGHAVQKARGGQAVHLGHRRHRDPASSGAGRCRPPADPEGTRVHLRHLSVANFRSYESAELPLTPGVTTLVGPNGQGKTNLVEAVGYLATLGSHRVATDAPLVRLGAAAAVVRARWSATSRETLVELELDPGPGQPGAAQPLAADPAARRARARCARCCSPPRTWPWSRATPSERRRFLDDLLVARQPRLAGVRADYERVLKQRNALLKSAAPVLRRGGAPGPAADEPVEDVRASALRTLDVWNAQLARVGAAAALRPAAAAARPRAPPRQGVRRGQRRPGRRQGHLPVLAARRRWPTQIAAGARAGDAGAARRDPGHLEQVRPAEVERGVSLVGPHRDDVVLTLGALPAKGYASHGESWSFALGLRLAAYELLRHDLGDDPVLILDDVFAELDSGRRERLATLVADCEQVLITAAVPAGRARSR